MYVIIRIHAFNKPLHFHVPKVYIIYVCLNSPYRIIFLCELNKTINHNVYQNSSQFVLKYVIRYVCVLWGNMRLEK